MEEIIGIDIGRGWVKTKHGQFRADVIGAQNPPGLADGHVLELADRQYLVGNKAARIRPGRMAGDDTFRLALTAVGLELKARGMSSAENTDIALAVGLPYYELSRLAGPYAKYLQRSGRQRFSVDGTFCDITIRSVSVCPQTLACIDTGRIDIGCTPTAYVVDIGASGTLAAQFDRGSLRMDRVRYYEDMGVVQAFSAARSEVWKRHGVLLSTEQIEAAAADEREGIPENLTVSVRRALQTWCEDLICLLRESGFRMNSAPAHFMGGGASLIHRIYYPKNEDAFQNVRFLEDLRENAAAYETMERWRQQIPRPA